ncbi:hypothetical protein [Bradyrhizobium sp. CCBAU 53421]|uniref:hypothetical protein n=1 Tax=Bradyrhizobium sp. CCBAU 53421 TaxID=1325120 RepID=UPI00188B5238|nr:hypothetical protein [Bradyrhizobium sp. CCBAU 53421]QOZ36908.1 hypothetical protein XH92_39590 [Bradyrhizobium sp. CCBAU 53421]
MSTYLHTQIRQMKPTEISRIVTAYERTLHALCVKDRDDPLTEMIAKTIIKVAQTDIADPAEISAQAIKQLEVR